MKPGGGIARRRPHAPGEEMVAAKVSWTGNVDTQLRETAKRRGIPLTELVREYVAAGLAKDAAFPQKRAEEAR